MMATKDGEIFKEINSLYKNISRVTTGQAVVDSVCYEDEHRIYFSITPNDGHYKDATVKFAILANSEYPQEAPTVRCLNRVYHPNIDLPDDDLDEIGGSTICVNTLSEDWTPALGLDGVIMSVLFLFHNPNVDDALSPVFGEEMTDEELAENVRRSIRGEEVEGVQFDRLVVGVGGEKNVGAEAGSDGSCREGDGDSEAGSDRTCRDGDRDVKVKGGVEQMAGRNVEPEKERPEGEVRADGNVKEDTTESGDIEQSPVSSGQQECIMLGYGAEDSGLNPQWNILGLFREFQQMFFACLVGSYQRWTNDWRRSRLVQKLITVLMGSLTPCRTINVQQEGDQERHLIIGEQQGDQNWRTLPS
ncbi:ubiquitin-conjugating enzyme E2 S [Aplysia californica]|uniref:Ubiquitin-conjugating enzyme E2 S n=1 Tax=Aplysia californica TaxID=6500 RepID=A0ABM0JL13_APLCA|nr:ubiquitin-conjugating enzyme E2 S [Aplysia californica]